MVFDLQSSRPIWLQLSEQQIFAEDMVFIAGSVFGKTGREKRLVREQMRQPQRRCARDLDFHQDAALFQQILICAETCQAAIG